MKIRQIGDEHEADAIVAAVARSAVRALAKLEGLRSTTALRALWSMKAESFGCDSLDADAPLNLIEQLNQTFTYIATARAAKQLLLLHQDLAPFTVNLGTASGPDIFFNCRSWSRSGSVFCGEYSEQQEALERH